MLGALTLLLGLIPPPLPKAVLQGPPRHRSSRQFQIGLLKRPGRDEHMAVGRCPHRSPDKVHCKSHRSLNQAYRTSHNDGVAAFSTRLEMEARHFTTSDLDRRYRTRLPLKEKQH